jgi:hypothetical protein
MLGAGKTAGNFFRNERCAVPTCRYSSARSQIGSMSRPHGLSSPKDSHNQRIRASDPQSSVFRADDMLAVRWLQREKNNLVRSTAELMLLADLDGDELRDAPGISQRVGNVFGGQLAHGQCPVAFEGGVNGASVDPFDVFSRTSTTSHFHQKFCIFHSLLSCLEGSAEKESLHR